MNLLSAIITLMYFVTDCDKTLVHYDAYEGDQPIETNEKLVALPPSSGSMKVAYVSKTTLHLLDQVSKHTDIICVSGMRYSTMMQRQYLFPHIKYWIVENGGQIYQRSKNDPTLLEEIVEWQGHLNMNGGSKSVEVLESVTTRLATGGWQVDRRGYRYMIRVNVKGKSTEEVQTGILAHLDTKHLAYTFNLGHLDIHIVGCGKYSSVRWLLSYLSIPADTPTTSTVVPEVEDLVPEVDKESTEKYINRHSGKYVFMGDDTNDIEIASHATLACIVTPCSDEMQSWLDSLETEQTTSAVATGRSSAASESVSGTCNPARSNSAEQSESDVALPTQHVPLSIRQHSSSVYSAKHSLGYHATEELLSFALRSFTD